MSKTSSQQIHSQLIPPNPELLKTLKSSEQPSPELPKLNEITLDQGESLSPILSSQLIKTDLRSKFQRILYSAGDKPSSFPQLISLIENFTSKM